VLVKIDCRFEAAHSNAMLLWHKGFGSKIPFVALLYCFKVLLQNPLLVIVTVALHIKQTGFE